MKKITALILVLLCIFSAFSCKKKQKTDENIETFKGYFETSIPTKTETSIRNTYSSMTFEGSVTLVTGTVDGKVASKLERRVDNLRELGDDLNPFYGITKRVYYLEGQGTSTNGRTWDPEGENFAPTSNPFLFNFNDAEKFSSIEFNEEKNSLTLKVAAENSKEVLGGYVNADTEFAYETTITITAAGGRIATVRIDYIVPGVVIGDIGSEIEVNDLRVSIRANYYYDIQDISFD